MSDDERQIVLRREKEQKRTAKQMQRQAIQLDHRSPIALEEIADWLEEATYELSQIRLLLGMLATQQQPRPQAQNPPAGTPHTAPPKR
jgi:hypothetical protein